MSRFESMIQIMRRDVCSPKHRRRFGEFRQRHALGAENMPAVLATLAERERKTYANREALTKALLTEYQSRPSSLWSSALIVAYGPMLLRLRNRLMSDDMPGDDLDQMVFETFLGVARRLSLDDPRGRLPMFLRQATQRAVFRILNDEAEYQEELDPLDDEPLVPGDHRRVEQSRDLASVMVEALSEADVDLLVATVLNEEPLSQYAQRISKRGVRRNPNRTVRRLSQRRTRAMTKLRRVARQRGLLTPGNDGPRG